MIRIKKNPSQEIKNRFYIEKADDGGYDLIDDKWGMVINFENKTSADYAAKFSRDYVKTWGDIDFSRFPTDLNTKLQSPDENYIRTEGKWKGKTLPNKLKERKSSKIKLIFIIVKKNNIEYIVLSNLETKEKLTFYLNVENKKLSDSYISLLINIAEKLGMDDYPNYINMYTWFKNNQEKILTFKDDYEFRIIKRDLEALK